MRLTGGGGFCTVHSMGFGIYWTWGLQVHGLGATICLVLRLYTYFTLKRNNTVYSRLLIHRFVYSPVLARSVVLRLDEEDMTSYRPPAGLI